MGDTKDFTIYLDGGRYVIINAEALALENASNPQGQAVIGLVIRLRTAGHVVGQFDGQHVIGWSEGGNPVKP